MDTKRLNLSMIETQAMSCAIWRDTGTRTTVLFGFDRNLMQPKTSEFQVPVQSTTNTTSGIPGGTD